MSLVVATPSLTFRHSCRMSWATGEWRSCRVNELRPRTRARSDSVVHGFSASTEDIAARTSRSAALSSAESDESILLARLAIALRTATGAVDVSGARSQWARVAAAALRSCRRRSSSRVSLGSRRFCLMSVIPFSMHLRGPCGLRAKVVRTLTLTILRILRQ